MRLTKNGEIFEYDGKTFTVGGTVVAEDNNEYRGLHGVITEITDGDDKDTENEGPDIYCNFDPPSLPDEIEELERRFSDLYGQEKTLDDICLDDVIMSPDMISEAED